MAKKLKRKHKVVSIFKLIKLVIYIAFLFIALRMFMFSTSFMSDPYAGLTIIEDLGLDKLGVFSGTSLDEITEIEIHSSDFDAQIVSIVDELITGKDLTDFDKYKILHDFTALYLEYNYDAVDKSLPQSIRDEATIDGNDVEICLDTGIAVCGGYAELYKALCDEADLWCMKITGEADFLSGENTSHAWNAVKLGNKIYHVDVCWDDTAKEGEVIYEWFLRGFSTLSNARRKWDQSVVFDTRDYQIARNSLKCEDIVIS